MLKAAAAAIIAAAGYFFLPIIPRADIFIHLQEAARKLAQRWSRPFLSRLGERRRTREIEEGLPVFLRQTAACLQASLTVRQTISECAGSFRRGAGRGQQRVGFGDFTGRFTGQPGRKGR